MRLAADVLVIGSGAAGMTAALAAAREGASVLLTDRSMIGRGGATVMAQMTVAAAIGSAEPDDPSHHLRDTLAVGRGLCDPALATVLCEVGVDCIRELDAMRIGWARDARGRIAQAMAPGHDRPRCVYVDFLSTGPAVSRVLRAELARVPAVRRVGDLRVTDLALENGDVRGAVAIDLASGEAVEIVASSVVIATGGITSLFARSSASANMGGDGHALALGAGAALIDMEFVQFFPIGHLAPRLVGMDPIMWDPFRYKLGGRLLNAAGDVFTDDAAPAGDRYVTPRDVATTAIVAEVAAGRGSPSGGVWLSFRHVAPDALRAAFGPVIDRLAANGIDLGRDDVEVAPIAHYHMGGIRVDASMATSVPGLFAAGEAVGGANGANRLSGNAVTEALAFGRVAGRAAASHARRATTRTGARPAEAVARVGSRGPEGENPAAVIAHLKAVMSAQVGPSRTQAGLAGALDAVRGMADSQPDAPPGRPGPYDARRIDWFDLQAMLPVAETVIRAAMARTESRGAHQRADCPHADPVWARSIVARRDGGALRVGAA